MLAVNPFVKTAPRRSGGRAPLPLPPSGVVVGASPSPGAGPTSPTGSAARRGRLHIQSGHGTVEQQTKERKAAQQQQQHVDGSNSDGSSSDSGYDSPVDRPRRRFVKPTVTTYETCFSRHAAAGGGSGASGGRRFNRRPGAGPRVGLASYSFLNSTSSASLALAAATAPSADDAANQLDTVPPAGAPPLAQGVRRAPAVSSLSSVLQELMHGRQRALSSYVDATAPQANPRTFVVQQDGDGAFFVASSTGERFAADSAIGKALLQPAPVRTTAPAPADATLSIDVPSSDMSGSLRRSDLDSSRVQRTPHSVRQSLSRRENSTSDSSNSSSGPTSSSKSKLLGFASLKSKLAARRSERASRTSLLRSGDDRPMTLDEIEHHSGDDASVVLGASTSSHLSNSSSGGSLTFHISSADDFAVPMLDPDLVDARARGDSSWEVPATGPAAGASSGPSVTVPLAVDKSQIVNRPIPFADDVDDDDDDNLLNRSFLNVRDIEFHPRTDKDAAPVSVPAAVLESAGCDDESDQQVSTSPVTDRATFDDDDDSANRPSATTRDSYASRGSSLSAGRASVSEFLGGYKGQLSTRRTSMGHDGGGSGAFVNRARSVRHGARRSAAANAAATALTRKLREARNRIPFEFRDDLAPPGKASKSSKRSGKKLRVRWDLTPYVREFEVESEDEADAAEAAIVKAPWEYKDGEAHESDDDDDDDDDDAQW